LASHEVIIPDSLEDMSWEIGVQFLMTLSKRVPVLSVKHQGFLSTLCAKVGVDLEAKI
jgi:hypothetical protein